jgi:hypothetical protein
LLLPRLPLARDTHTRQGPSPGYRLCFKVTWQHVTWQHVTWQQSDLAACVLAYTRERRRSALSLGATGTPASCSPRLGLFGLLSTGSDALQRAKKPQRVRSDQLGRSFLGAVAVSDGRGCVQEQETLSTFWYPGVETLVVRRWYYGSGGCTMMET